MVWEDFGQKVDLTARLREILLNYPEGTSILKELIQNADDARATTVRFCLDHRQHTTDGLLGPAMAAFQGPALLVYNDAVFSEKDFESISRIGDSVKREQAGKTGRFGIGFNSCYHLTDIPSFVSDRYLAIFDPHCKYLPNISSANPGKKINFVDAVASGPSAAAVAMGQLAPYQGVFGCDLLRGQPWSHTLFRFPLRTEELARASSISKQAYTIEKIQALLAQLAVEAQGILLFLKTVARVEVLEWQAGADKAELRFSCGLANNTPSLAAERSLFIRASAAVFEALKRAGTDNQHISLPPMTSVYALDLVSTHYPLGAKQGSQDTQRYLISQALGTGPVAQLAQQLSRQFTVPLIPWAAVAARVPELDGASSQAEGGKEQPAFKGQAYCFLPLPAFTGLPVHVNAFFELSSNRRDIWHGEDMAGLGAARAAWNKSLLSEVAATAYTNLVMQAVSLLGPGPRFYSLWPQSDVPLPWQTLLRSFYMRVASLPVAHTRAEGGQWLKPSQVVLPDNACVQAPALATALEAAGLPLADVPAPLVPMWESHMPDAPSPVSPARARAHLRAAGAERQARAAATPAAAAVLLDYCVAGITLADVSLLRQEVLGLAIIPLVDGSVGTFGQAGHHSHPLIMTTELELNLLRDVAGSLLVDCSRLHDETVSWLWGVAQLATLNVCAVDARLMAQRLLLLLLPQSARSDGGVVLWGTPDNPLTRARVELLWKWLSQQSSLELFNQAPILPSIPTQRLPQLSREQRQPPAVQVARSPAGCSTDSAIIRGELRPLGVKPNTRMLLLPSEDVLTLLHSQQAPVGAPIISEQEQGAGSPAGTEGDGGAVSEAQSAASASDPSTNQRAVALKAAIHVGVRLVDTVAFQALPVQLLTSRHCHVFDGHGVLAALANVGQGWDAREWDRAFADVPASARMALRALLLTPECLRAAMAGGGPGTHTARTAHNADQQQAKVLLQALRLMPIYPSTRRPVEGLNQNPDGVTAHDTVFVNLDSPCYLQPDGFDASCLAEKYITGFTPVETQLLVDMLGVTRITAAQAYRAHVIPHLGSFPPHTRTTLTLSLLRALPTLSATDPAFLAALAPVALVPNGKGALCTADILYDPREPDLVAMLDRDTSFPVAPYSEDTGALAGLVLLGMRQQPGLDTLLEAARHVQRQAQEADAAAGQAQGQDEQRKAQELCDMAQARGKALLAYLEVEAARLTAMMAYSKPGASQSQPAAQVSAAPGSATSSGGAADSQGGGRRFGGLFAKMQELFVGGETRTEGPGQGGQPGQGDRRRDHQQARERELASFWAEMASIRWCPVLAPQALPVGLPACTLPGAALLAAPEAVRPDTDMWLASATLHILDGESRSSVLASGLGWAQPLSGKVLGTQLKQLGTAHPALRRDASEEGQGVGKADGASMAQQLAEVVPQLYRSTGQLPNTELSVACEMLHKQPCVWVGSGFVEASKVAFQGSLDLSPWLYVLPAELAPFRGLLKKLGVTESFSAAQYIALLSEMHQTYCAAPTGTAPARALPPAQLAQAIAAVQALADTPLTPQGKQGAQSVSTVYVPDEKSVLVPAGELAYNDAPWMAAAGDPTGAAGGLSGAAMGSVRLVHPKISNHIADRVGVASLRRLLLAQASDSVALGLVTGTATMGAAEAFGQSEALTTRLRHIIQDYPEGPGVLMELLQNADDAGATQFKLMLDTRQHPIRSILGPGMAALQGPALLAYNNAIFSPSDFSAIARIGQDSKLERPAATGRFGLGFNAVYHLTDVPSFVSNDYIVLFDPHTKYVPGVNAAQPGLRIAFQRANLISQFPDAFTPYTQFGCTLREPYAGTLFRFPLRTATMASDSDIKPNVTCSVSDVFSLFQAFKSHLPQALLFLKHIREVEVLALTSDSNEPQMLYMASREVQTQKAETVATQQIDVANALTSLQEPVLRFLQEAGATPAALGKALSKCPPLALPKAIGTADLVMRTCPGTLAAITGHIRKGADADTSSAATEQSGLASGAELALEMAVERQQWVIANALGNGEAQAIAARAAGTSGVKMIPWVGVAAQLPSLLEQQGGLVDTSVDQGSAAIKQESQGDVMLGASVSAVEGRAFCFLPLPVRTGLPVHVNAFFELSSNRRDIWHGGDMSGAGARRAAWNMALLRDGLAPLYAQLLLEASATLGPGRPFYSLFPPGRTDLKEPWGALSESFYRQLTNLPVIWVDSQGGRWLAPNQVVFVADALPYPDLASLPDLLSLLGLPVARHMPRWLERLILAETPGANALTPALVRAHIAGTVKRGGAAGAQAFAATLAQFDKQQSARADLPAAPTDSTDAVQSPAMDTSRTMSAAVMLLQYCTSDLGLAGAATGSGHTAATTPPYVSPRDNSKEGVLQALSALDGCPLLPVEDGSLGVVATPAGPGGARQPRPAVWYFLPTTPVEQRLLAGLPHRTISHKLPSSLLTSLLKLSREGIINIAPITPKSLDTHVLPLFLPPAWRGQTLVPWAEPQTAGTQPAQQSQQQPQNGPEQTGVSEGGAVAGSGPTREWIQVLWTYLAALSDPDRVTELASWPLLPVKGGKLASLSTHSQVLRAGDWHDVLTSSLSALGCLLLDTDALTLLAANQPPSAPQQQQPDKQAPGASLLACQALQLVVRPPTLHGVLSALQAAAAGKQGIAGLGEGHVWPALEASEARQLRAFCLQPKWFAGQGSQDRVDSVSGPLLQLLFSLPIYEVYAPETGALATSTAEATPQQASTVSTSGPDSQQDSTQVPVSAAEQSGGADLQESSATSGTEAPASKATPQATSDSPAAFSALDQRYMYLPPDGVRASLLALGPPQPLRRGAAHRDVVTEVRFLRCEVMGEARVLADHLGVRRMAVGDFLVSFIQPHVSSGGVSVHQVNDFVLPLVRSLAGPGPVGSEPGAQERAQLRECLKTLPLFPTESSYQPAPVSDAHVMSGQTASPRAALKLSKVTQLFDPRVTALRELFPEDRFFPAKPYVADSVALNVLRDLGMTSTATLEVLVCAAEVISADYAEQIERQGTTPVFTSGEGLPSWAMPLLARARALLRQLCALVAEPRRVVGDAGDAGQNAWGRLQGLTWAPVLLTCPEQGLPWPSAGQPLLAAPRVLRPPSDAWSVSATLQLLETSSGSELGPARIAVPEVLRQRLGWSVPVRASVLCAQLMELGRMYPSEAKIKSPADAEEQHTTDTLAPVAGSSLLLPSQETDDHVDAREQTEDPSLAEPSSAPQDNVGEASQSYNVNSEVRGTGAGDRQTDAAAPEASRAAVVAAVEAGLHGLYQALCEACDGPQVDLMSMTFERGDRACVWVGNGLVTPGKVVMSASDDSIHFRPWLWTIPGPFARYQRFLSLIGVMTTFTPEHFKGALSDMAISAGGLPLSPATDLMTALQLAEALADTAQRQGASVGSDVMLPSESGVMFAAEDLCFNDAEWLSTEGVVFSHHALPHATAEVLGVKSLRFRQQQIAQNAGAAAANRNARAGGSGAATEPLPCLGPEQVSTVLGLQAQDDVTPAVVLTLLSDLVEVADLLGGYQIQVTLDLRRHNAQSLLHPGLGKYQGPALCIALPGVEVTPQELSDLMTGAAGAEGGVRVRGHAPSVGLGLLGAFTVTEIPQVISGSVTVMWDPSGRTLLRSAKEEAAAMARAGTSTASQRSGGVAPRAQQYRHVAANMPATFADQYGSAWSWAETVNVRQHVNATLIRLPLTPPTRPGAKVERPFGWSTASLATVQEALRHWQTPAAQSLLFCRRIRSLTIRCIAGPAFDATVSSSSTPEGISGTQEHATSIALSTTTRATRDTGVFPTFQASVSWDPENPRFNGAAVRDTPGQLHTGGHHTPPHSSGNKNVFTKMFGKVTAAAAAVAGHDAVHRASRPVVRQHETVLDLITARQGQGSVHESWLVSSWLEESPRSFGGSAAAAGASRDAATGVAVCLARSDAAGQTPLPPTSGLFPITYPSVTPTPADNTAPTIATNEGVAGTVVAGAAQPTGSTGHVGAAATQPGAALAAMQFLVYSSFCWMRAPHGLRRIVPLLAATDAAPHAGASTAQQGPPMQGPERQGALPHPPAQHQQAQVAVSAHAAARAAHNKRLVQGLGAAWLAALRWLLLQRGPAAGQAAQHEPVVVYTALMPDLPAVHEGRPWLDDLSKACMHEMYQLAAFQPLWRLRLGNWVTLKDGHFLDPDLLTAQGTPSVATQDPECEPAQEQGEQGQGSISARLGADAAAVLLRHMPILDVPWRVAQSLRSVGLGQLLRIVAPGSVRDFVKQHSREWVGRRIADDTHAGRHHTGQQHWSLSASAITQLLAFCMSDIDTLTSDAPASTAAAAVTSVPRPDTAAQTPRSQTGQSQDLFGGLFPANVALNDIVQTLNQNINRAVDVVSNAIENAAAQTQQAAGAAGSTSHTAGHVEPGSGYDVSRLRQCVGLPAVTVPGVIVALGTSASGPQGRGGPPVLVIPPECGQATTSLLPPQCYNQVLHPSVAEVLLSIPAPHADDTEGSDEPACLLQDPDARAVLGIRLFNLQLPGIDPPVSGWDIPGATPQEVSSRVTALGVAEFGPAGRIATAAAAVARAARPGAAANGCGAAVGVSWGGADGPTPQWLHDVTTLIARLAEAGPRWRDPSLRLSDVDGWPLLPLVPIPSAPAPVASASHHAASSSQPSDAAPRLLHMAYRAIVTRLPAEFSVTEDLNQEQSNAGLNVGLAEQGSDSRQAAQQQGDLGPGSTETDVWDPFSQQGQEQPVQAAAVNTASVAVLGRQGGTTSLPEPPSLNTLVSLAPSPQWSLVVRVLVTSGCPVLDPRFSASLGPFCAPHLDTQGSEVNVRTLISKLRWTKEAQGGLITQHWDSELRDGLLSLLADNAPSSLISDDMELLRSLPLYPSLNGTRISLTDVPEGAPKPSVCPASVLEALPGLREALPEDVLSVLLEQRPSLTRLYGLLGIETLTVAGLLGQCVVPALPLLPETVQAHVLTYILYNWASLKSEASLVSALKECAFVEPEATAGSPDDTSARVRPSQLYDPSHALYGAVYANTGRFPGGQFAFPAWLEVLRDVGMRHEVNTDDYLTAARHVAAQGSVMDSPDATQHDTRQRVLAAACALMDYLSSHFHTLLGKEFYEALAETPFVPAVLGIPGGNQTRAKLVRYKECAAPKDWPLCWTVLPTLMTSASVTGSNGDSSGDRAAGEWRVPASVAPYLRLRSPPPFASVVQHLKSIGVDSGESVLASWPAGAPLTPEAAFDLILEHLHKEGLSANQTAQLRDVPFLPVANGARLVPPSHTFVRLKEDLAPLAYEVPARYVSRLDLLKSLGSQEAPSAQWVLDMLQGLARVVGQRPLNVNQRGAVIRCLTLLHTVGTKPGSTDTTGGRGGSSAASAISAARAQGRLLVLSADGRLCPANEVVTVSAAGSRLLGRIDTHKLRFAHPHLATDVAAWLGCAPIQETVEEVLDLSQPLQPVDAIGLLPLETVRQLLRSVSFIHAAWACVQSHAPSVAGMQLLTIQQVAGVLRPLASQLHFVASLSTRVVMRATRADLTPPGDIGVSRVFEFKCTDPPRHYIAEPPPGLTVEFLLASVVSRALGAPLTLPLQPLFVCPPALVSTLQPMLLPGGWDKQLETASRAGEPGAPLYPTDVPLVQLRPLRRYPAGELVAVSRDTVTEAAAAAGVAGSLLRAGPGSAAAEAAQRRESAAAAAAAGVGGDAGGSAGSSSGGAAGGEGLCYARVAADAAPAGSPLFHTSLEVEPGVVVPVLSSKIYSFSSGLSEGPEDIRNAPALAGPSSTQPQAVAAGLRGLAAGPAAPTQPSTTAGQAAQAGAAGSPAAAAGVGTAAAAAAAPVGSAQLVSAVKDLLGAAGLPLSVDQTELLSKAAETQAQLTSTQRELQTLRERAAAQQSELEAGKSGWTCKICYARDLDASFTGCGHMLCHECARGLDRCPVCRKRSTLIRLYK